MPKLIRDLIPEDMRDNGYEPELVRVQGPELRQMLLRKLLEESKEAADSDGSPDELADVYEVVRCLAHDQMQTMRDIATLADDKKDKRGGFRVGYVWVNDEDTSPEAETARHQYRMKEAGARQWLPTKRPAVQ